MAGLVVGLAACGTGSDASDGDRQLSPSSLPDTTISSSTTSTLDLADLSVDTVPEPDYNAIVEAAQADLAERLGATVSDIEIESVQSGVWNDGSIGCPQSGTSYTQALVEGSLIVLGHGEDSFEYHQSGEEPPFLCEVPKEDSFIGEEGDVLLPPPRYDE